MRPSPPPGPLPSCRYAENHRSTHPASAANAVILYIHRSHLNWFTCSGCCARCLNSRLTSYHSVLSSCSSDFIKATTCSEAPISFRQAMAAFDGPCVHFSIPLIAHAVLELKGLTTSDSKCA